MGVNKININNNDSNYAHSIFDISEYTGKTYDTLSDALADVPDGKQKGGMTVSFVSTSDNTYVQYFLRKNTWSASEADWEKMNLEEEISQLGQQVEPAPCLLPDIDKYVKSKDIYDALGQLKEITTLNVTNTINGKLIKGTYYPFGQGTLEDNSGFNVYVFSLEANKIYNVYGYLGTTLGVTGAAIYTDQNCTSLIKLVFDSSTGTSKYNKTLIFDEAVYLGVTLISNGGICVCKNVEVVPKFNPLDYSIFDFGQKINVTSTSTNSFNEVALNGLKDSYLYILPTGTTLLSDISSVYARPTKGSSTGQYQLTKVTYNSGIVVKLLTDIESLYIYASADSTFSISYCSYIEEHSITTEKLAPNCIITGLLASKCVTYNKLSENIFNELFEHNLVDLNRYTTIESYFIRGSYYGGNKGSLQSNSDCSIAVYSLTAGEYEIKGHLNIGNGITAVALYQDSACTNLIGVVTDSTSSQDYEMNITVEADCFLGMTIQKDTTNNDKVTSYGEIERKQDSKTSLRDYTLYSLGDSLSVPGKWQGEVSSKTGCLFDNSKNIRSGYPLSVGGSSSYGTGFFNLLWRVKNLVSQNVITGDGENTIIVLQNANDAWNPQTFEPSARSFIPGNIINAGLESEFNSAVLSNIPSASRDLNAVLSLENIVSGTNVKITTLPVREGNVRLSIEMPNTGMVFYSMHMVPQATDAETMQYCLERILEYQYTGINDTLGADNESVNFSEEGSGRFIPLITFTDVDNTGMQVTISETSDARSTKAYYFTGNSIQDSDWAVVANWKKGLTFSEGIKSGIEFLKRTYPKAHIFLTMFPVYNVTPSSYLNDNGTYNHYGFYNSSQEANNRSLLAAYTAIASFYQIPIINVLGLSGINLDNLSTYYYDNNVHPKDIGYNKIGDVLAAALRNYF